MPGTPRPTRIDLEAARDATIPDVIAPGLSVLFCGINPSLYSGATGWHFARPGNRFWAALHGAGFTPQLLRPSEQELLPMYGLGVTNLVARATARADELSADELRAGGRRLRRLARRAEPDWIAVVGVTAFRHAFEAPDARIGPRTETIGPAKVWVLPNPSGLNAHYTIDGLAEAYSRLRAEALPSR